METPASPGCGVDVAERSEGRHDGDGAAVAFPWQTDTTRTEDESPPRTLRDFVPIPVVDGVHSLSHEVLVILKASVGKAIAVWQPADSPLQRLREQRAACIVDETTGQLVDPTTGEIVRSSDWSKLTPAEQLDECKARADQRAKSAMSDYMVHNRLTTMWVLTNRDELHGAEGRREMMARVADFMRRLRRTHFRGKPFPYVYSPELHPGGHGWHCNVFLQRQYIDKRQMDRMWSHGNTWFTDFTTARDDPWGRKIGGQARARDAQARHEVGARAARTAAAYGSKYAQKDWDTDVLANGAHRYERSEGFNVPEQRFRARTVEEAMAALIHHPAVGNITFSWSRQMGQDGWHGPNMSGISFDHRATPRRQKRGPSDRSVRPLVLEAEPRTPAAALRGVDLAARAP